MLGADAGPSKLAAIKKNNLKTLDEDGFLQLIATRVPDYTDKNLAKKIAKEQDAIRAAAHEMERREREIEKKDKGKEKEQAKYVVDPEGEAADADEDIADTLYR